MTHLILGVFHFPNKFPEEKCKLLMSYSVAQRGC